LSILELVELSGAGDGIIQPQLPAFDEVWLHCNRSILSESFLVVFLLVVGMCGGIYTLSPEVFQWLGGVVI